MKLISKPQLIFFQYLFLREDITIHSIYEIFILTEDIPDFLENLKLLDINTAKRAKFVIKLILYEFFTFSEKYDSYDLFDEAEKQLSVLYLFGNYLEITEKIILEEV